MICQHMTVSHNLFEISEGKAKEQNVVQYPSHHSIFQKQTENLC